jgi:hypothetical protein
MERGFSLNRRRFLKYTMGMSVVALSPVGWMLKDNLEKEEYNSIKTLPLNKYREEELKNIKFCFHPPHEYYHNMASLVADLIIGMKAHGIKIETAPYNEASNADVEVIFSWGQSEVIRQAKSNNRNIMVLEQGFFSPRDKWLSIGFNGHNGYAKFSSPAENSGKRFDEFFSDYFKPWQKKNTGTVLVVGQLPWGVSLHGLNLNSWLHKVTNKLLSLRYKVIYRPHPEYVAYCALNSLELYVPQGAVLSKNKLLEDFSISDFVVAYGSTAAVESILYGIPAVVMSEGSMAYPVASHSLENPIYTPDRTEWCNRLAWCQWNEAELRSGEAWEHAKQAILL